MIDLRSDTATRPSDGMRAAIATAAVGDEQKREDPTVNELEERAARLLGQPEAVFLPTATMANQIAIRLHTDLGDELIGEENCHVFISELGGPAVHSGVVTRGLPGVAGRFTRRAGARRLPRPEHALAAHAAALGREHAQRERRPGLAARGARRARTRSRTSSVCASTSTARGS